MLKNHPILWKLGPFILNHGYVGLTSVRRREVNIRREEFATYQDFMEASSLPPQSTMIATIHVAKEPPNWNLARENGWPPYPADGLQCFFIRIPSSMRHVGGMKDSRSDNVVMLAFSSRRHTHLKAARGPLQYLFSYACYSTDDSKVCIPIPFLCQCKFSYFF